MCIHACVCISDSRLSLKLKQKSVHPPSQLYLFMPSASQHPHACKHTTHPVRVTQTHQKKQAPRWGLVTRDFVLIIPCRSEESPLITRFLAQREVIVYHILCTIFIYTPPFNSFLLQDINNLVRFSSHFFGSLQHRPRSNMLAHTLKKWPKSL